MSITDRLVNEIQSKNVYEKFYFVSQFACFFVFSELLRSQNNLSAHKPEICLNVTVTKWKNNTDCKTDPTFSAAGPQVGSEQPEQVKTKPGDKTLNLSEVKKAK